MNQIVASGPFLQVFLEEGAQDNSFFSQVFTSKRLARFALQSYLALVASSFFFTWSGICDCSQNPTITYTFREIAKSQEVSQLITNY